MRITPRAVVLTSMHGLNRNLSAVGNLQEQLTSGRTFSKPSESPTGTNQSMQIRAERRAAEQHARNISDGKGWLAQADSALQTMTNMARRVRDLAVQANNTGAMSATAKQALSAEVTEIRNALLGVANQTIDGRPVFGGVTGGNAAYDTTGAWIGSDAAAVTRRISDIDTVRIDITGPEAFGPPGNDLFTVVDRIAKAVTGDPAALGGHMDDLDVAMDRMITGLADVGARHARIEHAEQTVSDRLLRLHGRLNEVESIDLPKTIMDLEMQRVGYEASLKATARVIQPSLLDFLR
jgi:flagellin-like hook-associated protein FlgL